VTLVGIHPAAAWSSVVSRESEIPPDVRDAVRLLSSNDARAADRLVPVLYEQLRSLAQVHLRREREDHTLGATALVHEVYLRIAGRADVDAVGRTRFLALASTTMRRVLVDHARARKRLKRGDPAQAVPLEAADSFLTDAEAVELVALDDALERLAAVNPRGSMVVQHRFFGGFTLEETADVLGVALKTVQRDWIAASAWLRKEVAQDLGMLGAQ
jgi:RNA polymerase sigma-70 factor, ECF subfamily